MYACQTCVHAFTFGKRSSYPTTFLSFFNFADGTHSNTQLSQSRFKVACSFQFNRPLMFELVNNIVSIFFGFSFYNATSFGYDHSVTRASDKMKSLLEIYTANVNRNLQVLYRKIRVLHGIWNQRKNNTNCSESDVNLEKFQVIFRAKNARLC